MLQTASLNAGLDLYRLAFEVTYPLHIKPQPCFNMGPVPGIRSDAQENSCEQIRRGKLRALKKTS
jgi:hypothetical protein